MMKALAGRLPAGCLRAVRSGLGMAARLRYRLKKGAISSVSHLEPTAARQIVAAYSPCPPATPLTQRPETSTLDLSVIIPVYNAESFLTGCIRSILDQQTSYSLEILAVDDCSKDASLRVLRSIEDPRLVVLHREKNGGSACARNDGLDQARGRYIMFVDADDRLLPGAVETLLSAAIRSKADVVQGQYVFFEQDGAPLLPAQRYATGTIKDDLAALSDYPGTPWMKVFARQVWAQTNFLRSNIYEDTVIWYLVFPRVHRFVCLPQNVYAYRQNGAGITAENRNKPKAADAYWAVEACLQLRREAGLPVDAAIYRMTLIQLSQLLYSRNRAADEKVLEALFVLAAEVVRQLHDALPAPCRVRGADLRAVEDALLRRDLGAWRFFSGAMK